MNFPHSRRVKLTRPTLLLVAGAIGVAGAGERLVWGRPQPGASGSRAEAAAVVVAPAVIAAPPVVAAGMAAAPAPVILPNVAAAPAPVVAPTATPAPAPAVVAPTPTPAPAPAVLATVTGEASYYAEALEGRRTASGSVFHNAEMVAAHRSYPFGTVLRVTNPRSGASVEVTVVDRGPFGRSGRILDLSRAAAARLGYIREGHADVEVEVLSWGDRPASSAR